MKQVLHLCSQIRGLFSASQCSDVGYDCRLTVVRPSFDCRSTMLKLCSILVIVLTVGVGQMWGSSPASVTMQSVVTDSSFTVSSGNTINTICLSINLDDNINISVNSSGNNGTFWGTGADINWRAYQTASGTYTLTASNGCTLQSVTFTYTVDKGGVLNTTGNGYGITTGIVTSGTAFSLSGTSQTFYVGNTLTTGTNRTKGQVRITAISVSYSSPVTCGAPTSPIKGSIF